MISPFRRLSGRNAPAGPFATAMGDLAEIRPGHAYLSFEPHLYNLHGDDHALMFWFREQVTRSTVACPAQGFHALEGLLSWEGRTPVDGLGRQFGDIIVRDSVAREAAQRIDARLTSGRFGQFGLRPADNLAMICEDGESNYGHFLIDMAPKIVNMKLHGWRHATIVVPESARWSLPHLRALGEALSMILRPVFQPADSLYRTDGVTFWSAVSHHPMRKSAAQRDLRGYLLATFGSRDRPHRKIYVARRGKRSIVNGSEVETLFSRLGFDIVQPERLTFGEQIRLFSEATHIAGPHGAGLTNTLFAPVGCEVFMIDPGVGDRFFWDLSVLVGQPFHWFFAAGLQRYSVALETGNYPVDLENLKSVLSDIGWQ